MPDADDERLAELCEQIWVQVRDLEPAQILAILLAVTSEVIAAGDTPQPLLDHACAMLAEFVRRAPEAAKKARRSHLRVVSKQGA